MKRRDFFRKAGIGSATVVSLPALAHALTIPEWARSPLEPGELSANHFVILLRGTYKRVVRCPDLGLFLVDFCDGSYFRTKIYPVSGLPEENSGHGNGETKKAIGNFYTQFAGSLAAYDLPGGAIAMVFTGSNVQFVPDGQGGTYIVGTFELDIPEATGIYQSFVGGHNTMVDTLHQLADGSFVEHCICIISRKV